MTKKPPRMPANAALLIEQHRKRKVRAIARKLARFDGFDLAAIPDASAVDAYMLRAAVLLKVAQR